MDLPIKKRIDATGHCALCAQRAPRRANFQTRAGRRRDRGQRRVHSPLRRHAALCARLFAQTNVARDRPNSGRGSSAESNTRPGAVAVAAASELRKGENGRRRRHGRGERPEGAVAAPKGRLVGSPPRGEKCQTKRGAQSCPVKRGTQTENGIETGNETGTGTVRRGEAGDDKRKRKRKREKRGRNGVGCFDSQARPPEACQCGTASFTVQPRRKTADANTARCNAAQRRQENNGDREANNNNDEQSAASASELELEQPNDAEP